MCFKLSPNPFSFFLNTLSILVSQLINDGDLRHLWENSKTGVREWTFRRLVPLRGRLQPKLAKQACCHPHLFMFQARRAGPFPSWWRILELIKFNRHIRIVLHPYDSPRGRTLYSPPFVVQNWAVRSSFCVVARSPCDSPYTRCFPLLAYTERENTIIWSIDPQPFLRLPGDSALVLRSWCVIVAVKLPLIWLNASSGLQFESKLPDWG
jgi:hypothetical protein